MPRANTAHLSQPHKDNKKSDPEELYLQPRRFPPQAPTESSAVRGLADSSTLSSSTLHLVHAKGIPIAAAECLNTAPLFRGLSHEECCAIYSIAHPHYFSAKDFIFWQGEPIRFGLVISTGWAKITRVASGGKEVILRIERPGAVTTMARDNERIHSFTAQALDSCWVLGWDGSFRRLAARFPALQHNATILLSERLSFLEERFEDLATQRVPQRLARVLLRLLGPDNGISGRMPISFSCEELSQMVGTTLFTVSRLLCTWAEQGIIRPERKIILVEDVTRLNELAEN